MDARVRIRRLRALGASKRGQDAIMNFIPGAKGLSNAKAYAERQAALAADYLERAHP
jgi:hypothetical protein